MQVQASVDESRPVGNVEKRVALFCRGCFPEVSTLRSERSGFNLLPQPM